MKLSSSCYACFLSAFEATINMVVAVGAEYGKAISARAVGIVFILYPEFTAI